jgi:hypothetical protein
MKKNRAYRAAMLFVGFSVLTQSACSREAARSTAPENATGVCYRRLEWLDAGELHDRFETLVVVQSSKSATDMARVMDMEDARVGSPFAHHLTPNRWHSGWLTDTAHDFTSGPSCAHLPAFVERR